MDTWKKNTCELENSDPRTWHVRWSGNMLLAPDGAPVRVAPGQKVDIAVAHERVDEWALKSKLYGRFRAEGREPV